MQLRYISNWGDNISLSDNTDFILSNVDGLTYSSADLATVITPGIDGDVVNNVQAQPRGIVLDLIFKDGVNIEEAKRNILKVVKLKQTGTLEWTQNGRTWIIKGIVEAVDMPRFYTGGYANVAMQITMHCSQPFWEDLNEVLTEINEYEDLFYFTDYPYDMLYFTESGIPFGEYDISRTRTFTNSGDVAVGMLIEIIAYGTVTNPVILASDERFFGLGTDEAPVVMSAGDKIFINTEKGKKNVYLESAGGVRTNLLNKVVPFSTWLQLEAGENEFSIDSEDAELENMTFNLYYKQRYI